MNIIRMVVISLAYAAFLTPFASWALTVHSAMIVAETVKIRGSGAGPNAVIVWEDEEIGQANSRGRFRVSSKKLPLRPQCVGVLEAVGLEPIVVEVDNCRGPIDGFYAAPQAAKKVPAGEFDSVISFCAPGDFAVSGSLVRFGPEFDVTSFGLLIDGSTGQQSWVFAGRNNGNDFADIRVSARCARVLPPKRHRPKRR